MRFHPHGPRPTRHTAPGITAALALLIVLTGCGQAAPPEGSGAPEKQPSQQSLPSDGPSGSTSPDGGATPAEQAPSEQVSPDPRSDLGEPAGSREGSMGKAEATLDIYPIKRHDQLVSLTFAVTLSESAEAKFQVADFFADSNYDASDGEGHSVDGVQLLDTKNAKLHQVASDGQKHCVCSRGLAASFIEPGQTMLFTAAYGAPPEDVMSMDVQVPHFGTVSNVAVQ